MSGLNLLLCWTWFSDDFKFNEYKNVAATKENETEIGALKTTHARNIICRKKMGCILQGGRWWVLYHKVYRVRECAQKRFNIIICIYLKRICCSIWPIIIQMSKIELMIKSIWYWHCSYFHRIIVHAIFILYTYWMVFRVNTNTNQN